MSIALKEWFTYIHVLSLQQDALSQPEYGASGGFSGTLSPYSTNQTPRQQCYGDLNTSRSLLSDMTREKFLRQSQSSAVQSDCSCGSKPVKRQLENDYDQYVNEYRRFV